MLVNINIFDNLRKSLHHATLKFSQPRFATLASPNLVSQVGSGATPPPHYITYLVVILTGSTAVQWDHRETAQHRRRRLFAPG